MTTILVFSVGVLIYSLTYILLNVLFRKRIILNQRFEELIQDDERHDFDDEINIPFSERIIQPTMKKIIGFFGVIIPMNTAMRDRLNKQLKQAEIKMSVQEYQGTVFIFTVVFVIAMVLYSIILGLDIQIRILFGVLGIYAALVISRFHLKKKITERKLSIYHQLPDAMDLLSVCVSAGSGFDSALSYLEERMQGPLIKEFETMRREITMGMRRKDALERFAERCDSEEVYIFVGAVNQADELGSSMKNVLETQAASIRLAHKQRVEEKAQKISIKMMLPLVLFILPVTFIIILGPAIPSIIAALGDF